MAGDLLLRDHELTTHHALLSEVIAGRGQVALAQRLRQRWRDGGCANAARVVFQGDSAQERAPIHGG